MFHFDRKLQQQESDTSSASDSTTDVTSRIGVITPTEDKEDAEAREAYESLMRHRKIRRRKKFIKVGIVLGIVVLLAIRFQHVYRYTVSDEVVEHIPVHLILPIQNGRSD